MNNYIAENIKNLRLQRGITQQKLAERLGVSATAVSKWERGETMPDIMLIIPIAAVFGVSTDILLGADKEVNEKKILEYITEKIRLKNIGDDFGAFELINRAYKEFPHDWRIICEYIYVLLYDPNYKDEPFGAGVHFDEIICLCQRVIDECSVQKLRFDALDYLFSVYSWTGKKDLARAVCDYFPDSLYQTKQEMILTGCEGEEFTIQLRKTISELVYCLVPKITHLAQGLTPEQQIVVYKKQISLIELIFEYEDYGFFLFYLGRSNCMIAMCYLWLEDMESAMKFAKKGLDFLVCCDDEWKKGEIVTHSSLLFKGITHNPCETSKSNNENWVAYELKRFDNFEPKIKNKQFLAILEKYKPFAEYTK